VVWEFISKNPAIGVQLPRGKARKAPSTRMREFRTHVRSLVRSIAGGLWLAKILSGSEINRVENRLLAAFGSQRERYGNAGELQMYSGIAPVMGPCRKR
jgi:hypothetical protein